MDRNPDSKPDAALGMGNGLAEKKKGRGSEQHQQRNVESRDANPARKTRFNLGKWRKMQGTIKSSTVRGGYPGENNHLQ